MNKVIAVVVTPIVAVLVAFPTTTLALDEAEIANQLLVEWKRSPNEIQVYESDNPEVALANLQINPQVKHVEMNQLRHITATPNDSLFSAQRYLQNSTSGQFDINAPEAWDTETGSNTIVVAVIDTGTDLDHPDLADNIWVNTDEIASNSIDDDGNGYVDDRYGWDTIENDNNPNPDFVLNGDFIGTLHGTHVAGTIGAVTNNATGVAGMMWDVQLMIIRAFDEEGNSTINDIVEGINYAIENGANIINMSYGGGTISSLERNAMIDAQDAGILSVAAAGNDDENLNNAPSYPACYPEAFTVAALTSTDARASFSNYGSDCVSVSAPGVNVYNTYAYDVATGWDDLYGYMSGTSMATPVVSGLAGLLLSYNDTLSVADLENYIINNAHDLSNTALGSGRVDAEASIQALADSTNPDSPTIKAYPNSRKKKELTTGSRVRTSHPYFTWNEPESPIGLAGYNVYFGTSKADPDTSGTLQTERNYAATGLQKDDVKYYLRLTAKDTATNTSEVAGFRLTIDNIMAKPTWGTITNQSNGLKLQWEKPKGDHVVGYHVYRAVGSQTKFTKYTSSMVTTENFLDTNVQRGKKYKYKIRAYDDIGNESILSNERKKEF